METWAIVVLVVGTSAISALLTFFITKMQVGHSDKRLEKELERAREADYRQRRWEVRGEPLLKLRVELARMAAMQARVVTIAQGVDAQEKLQEALVNWNAHLASGGLHQTMFMNDKELFDKVLEIDRDYHAAYTHFRNRRKLQGAQQEEAIGLTKKVWPKVIEVQELINKRLEKL